MDVLDANAFLNDVNGYIHDTFQEHYSSDGGIQLVDFFHSNGDGMAYARTSAMRYLARYGKKDGYNKRDLLKAVHCICLLYFFSKDESNHEKRDVSGRDGDADWRGLHGSSEGDPEQLD
jgi:hypothetical protein